MPLGIDESLTQPGQLSVCEVSPVDDTFQGQDRNPMAKTLAEMRADPRLVNKRVANLERRCY